MSQSKLPRFIDQEYSCPGKVFILGEYAVLQGAGAVVAALGPRFTLHARQDSESAAPHGFHAESPVARLLEWASLKGVAPGFPGLQNFDDPHRGKGGFGASTAQFALAYRALGQVNGWDMNWKRVWSLYRELTGFSPSGADLVAQWIGGVVGIGEGFDTVEDFSRAFAWKKLLVFSATSQPGRKVPTHEHLARLGGLDMRQLGDQLRRIILSGKTAIASNDVRGLGEAMDRYGEVLAGQGLELEATRSDRLALRASPGVAGVKGAGALQADAVLVLMESENSENRKSVLTVAASRGLQLVCDGIEIEAGVSCAN